MKRLSYILLSGLMLILSACEKDTESSNFAPVVTTGTASNIYRMGATLSGSIQLTETNTAKSYGILVSSFESMAEATEYPVKDASSNFSVQIQNLEPGTTYYYCAYASSGYSTAKSQIKSFTTTNSNAPVFNEVILQSKDEKSCTVSVEILDEGGSDLLISGFVLGESGKGDPTATNNIKIQNVEPQGSRMSATFSGLEPNKTYLVRAYGINASGTGYSNSVSVTTNTATVPFLIDITRVDSTEVSVTVKSAVLDAGLGEVSKYGFCYSSESKEPTTAHLVVENVEGNIDEFTALIENLNPETTYYFRAFAENEKGVGYSNVIEYTTKQVLIQGTEGDVHVEEAGGLSKFIDETNKYNITKLKVSGYLNGDDIRLIREMAGRDVNGNETNGRLVDLDISEATIVEGGGAYFADITTEDYIVGDSMFYNTILRTIQLPNNIRGFGSFVFGGCSSLADVTIPNSESIHLIESNLFNGCISLSNIDLPDAVTYIGYKAFYSCSSLSLINIPDGVTTIGGSAFFGCSSLTKIDIPDNVSQIGEDAFRGCSSLTSINIPSAISSIWAGAFSYCSSLTSVVIPETITAINTKAFYECSSLVEVTTLATTPPTLGDNVFTNIVAPAILHVPSGTYTAYNSSEWAQYFEKIDDGESHGSYENGVATVEEAGTLSSLIPESEKYTITKLKVVGSLNGDDIRFIREMAGRDVNSNETTGRLVDLDISEATIVAGGDSYYEYSYGNYVNNSYYTDNGIIGEYMFWQTNIENVILPDGVTSIGESAFRDCSFLTSIDIPDGVTEIGDYAFCDCSSLKSIAIPDGVTSIGRSAFNGCSSLTLVNIPEGVISIGQSAFGNCSSLTSINIPDGVTSIGQSAFEGCSSLTSIDIPDGVTSIGPSAFESCLSLTSIDIPDGVTSIDESTFESCLSLTSIVIPDGVTSIGNGAFAYCSTLGSVVFPDGVTEISPTVFFQCFKLTDFTIPEGVTKIGYSAFFECNLSNIIIPNTVKMIGVTAFSNCPLTSIDIPDSVTSIGTSAFEYCSLQEVTIGSGLTELGDYAFYYGFAGDRFTIRATTPPTIKGSEMFNYAGTGVKLDPKTLYVPTGCATAYSESKWAQFFENIIEM